MNRRGFIGTALAGLGVFFIPQKLFALINTNSCVSNEDVLWRVLEKSQDHVVVMLHSPMFCGGAYSRRTKDKSDVLIFDNLSFLLGDSFGFTDKHLQAAVPIDNILSLIVCFEDGTRMFCAHLEDGWDI